MAGRGPVPKAVPQRARDEIRRRPAVSAMEGAPTSSPGLPDGYDWLPLTREWWQTWAESPQATTFVATDWLSLIETAFIANELFGGNAGAAGELRLRVAKFGATPEDRQRLNMRIEPPQAAPVRPLRPAQRRLKAVDGDAVARTV